MLKLLLGFCLGLFVAIQYPGVPERLMQLFSAVAARAAPEAVRDPLPPTSRASAPTAEFPVGKSDTPIPLSSPPPPVLPTTGDGASGEGEALRRAQWAEVRNVIEKSREVHP